ncbi:Terminal uridylyltransferase 4 [Linnemannia zychae]|nr:Terminal uridylyltransferase 4 [Linnemannia zychae]
MSYKRSEFIGHLWDCILFEYAGQIPNQGFLHVSLADLAGAMAHIKELYQDDYDGDFEIPSNIYIDKYGLDDPQYLRSYIESLDEGTYDFFPYSVYTYNDDTDSEDEYWDRDSYYDDSSDDSDSDADYTILHAFSGQETQEFLDHYACNVPRAYHDEIAALIQALRDDYFDHRGSGGTYCILPNGWRGATKFSASYNDNKREKIAQRAQELEDAKRRQREEAEERERLERERREQAQRNEARLRRNQLILTYMNKLRNSLKSSQERDEQVDALRSRLERNLQEVYGDYEIEVHTFGSFASGLSSKNSDADFTVYNCEYDIADLATMLEYLGYEDVTYIGNARVPIVTFYDSDRDIQCDVNIEEPMGVINSKLIATYRKIDKRFLTLWFSIRQIAKKHGILSGSTGFLSSYALTMMMIVFLQDVANPAVLPRLQLQSHHRMVSREVDGWDCTFDHNWSNHQTYGSDNPSCAAQLLVEFCHFYGYKFDYATKEVNSYLGRIRNRSFTPPPRSRRDRRPKEWPICVLDPFITDRNVAGNCHRDAVIQIRDCFRDACDALKESDINRAFRR